MNQKGAIFAQKKLAGGRKKKGKKAKKEEKDLKLLDGERAMLHVILIMLILGRIRLLLLVLEDVHGGGDDLPRWRRRPKFERGCRNGAKMKFSFCVRPPRVLLSIHESSEVRLGFIIIIIIK